VQRKLEAQLPAELASHALARSCARPNSGADRRGGELVAPVPDAGAEPQAHRRNETKRHTKESGDKAQGGKKTTKNRDPKEGPAGARFGFVLHARVLDTLPKNGGRILYG
jgi:hypothetical protein